MRNRSHIKGSSRRRENRKGTAMVLLMMVPCLPRTGIRTSYTPREASQAAVPDTSQDISPETIGDITGTVIIEYGNLRGLLKQGNLSLKESIEDYESNINAYQEIQDTLKRKQGSMEDRAGEMGGKDSQTAGIYSFNAVMLKSSTSRIYNQLNTMTSEKSTRNLEKSADTFIMATQTPTNSYNQMVQNVEYQEKRVESLQAAFEAMVRKQATGTVTQTQLKKAKGSLDTAGNSLESLGLQAGELRYRLFIILGIENSSQVVIGVMPEPDMAVIKAVGYEDDKNRAMGDDKNAQNVCHIPASSTTETNIKFRLANEAEGTEEAAFLASCQNLQISKAVYEAALTAFQGARLTYEGLQRKQWARLLTSTGHLEGQATCLEKKVAKETVSTSLAATYESYCWDVKGISQT